MILYEEGSLMNLRKSKRLLLVLAVAYWALVAMVFFVAGDRFHYTVATSDTLSPVSLTPELVDGMVLSQKMRAPADQLTSLAIRARTFERANTGTMVFSLLDAQGQLLARVEADIGDFANDAFTEVALALEGHGGEMLTLEITTQGCAPGNAVALYFGDTILVGRFDIAQAIPQEELYLLDGVQGAGKLCVRMSGIETLTFYQTYWVITGVAFALLAGYALYAWRNMKKGKNNALVMLLTLNDRYAFLLKQLVSRDFKAKYKRSVLGMAWSFLNPLLTMLVQYIVFSSLFQSDIANFPVYLLTGIVFFSFFNEAVSMGMTSITGNASLIKKVYMPKYIYPVSRLVSSLINFALSFIPLLLVMLITGLSLRPSLLLLVFDLLCLLCFVMGMSLLLTTCMTFFQDTQFLWGVVSMLWMYLTPIFYPESIIPQQFLTLYHMNPMYQYITFARICIIDGASPAPAAYLWCIIPSAVVLALGLWVFKKHQNRFVLYL